MSRRALWVPLGCLLAAAVSAVTIAAIAVGSGITNPALGCAPSSGSGFAAASDVVSGQPLSPGQVANAWIIYSVGAGLGLPQRAEAAAIAAAMQDSGLENLPYGSSGSVGLFGQSPSPGAGTIAQIMNPVYAARAFYLGFSQAKDGSFPRAYARWRTPATRLAAIFSGGTGACAVSAGNAVPAGTSAKLPGHYRLPAGTPVSVDLAIRFALAQLGTAYQYGGSCTGAHSSDLALHCDCSSLVQQAYRAGGIPLPRTTYSQVNVGTPVYSVSSLRPGDLLFLAGADGSPSSPGHVGMYIGDGLVIQAPEPGQDVQLTPLSEWSPVIVAMRRIA
ncbi:MAG TPA: C40 family peptidase [Streptosporangiaceae bacterium]|nr:C40 family peptidase [Streptosporangiaceae bacterium]